MGMGNGHGEWTWNGTGMETGRGDLGMTRGDDSTASGSDQIPAE